MLFKKQRRAVWKTVLSAAFAMGWLYNSTALWLIQGSRTAHIGSSQLNLVIFRKDENMVQAEAHPERVRRIKERMKELGWTRQRLVDEIIDAGDISSLASVKRVCAEGSEEKKFKEITLQPLEKALGLLDEVKPLVMSESTELFYQRIITELNAQVKEQRKAHTIKNVAIIVLISIQAIWLLVDFMMPTVGWYQTGSTVGWFVKFGTLLLFCLAAFIYVKIKQRGEERSEM